MIRILTGASVDPKLVEHVLASVPEGAKVEVVAADHVPAVAARIDTTSRAGERRSVVAVCSSLGADVADLLDTCNAKRIVQLPAGSASLTRFLATAV